MFTSGLFTSGLIVFREVFEMAIIISVIFAATRQVAYRSLWVWGGIAVGAATVGVMAFFAQAITLLATRLGQHVFNALVLFLAAGLISWSVIWMQKHGRIIAAQMKQMGQSIQNGSVPLYMLAVVVGLAVLREGSEIVLFLYGVYTTGDASIYDLVFGLIGGTIVGSLTGVVMYYGLIRIPVKQLFSISGWLLAFLAAGMVAKGIGHLVAAEILPAMLNPIWNTSSILSQKSAIGRFLSVLLGYQDQPSGIQVMFYLATLVLISFYLIPKKQAQIK